MYKKGVRRSLLYTPGNERRKCEKALSSNADSVIFDLEDAVIPSQKLAARETVRELLGAVSGKTEKELIVRINAISTLTGVEDLLMIRCCPVDAIILPKICLNDLITADTILSGMEQALGIAQVRLIGLLETAIGCEQLSDIVKYTPRLAGVQLGAEDLTKELGIVRSKEGHEIELIRSRIALATCAYGLDAIDTPFADYTNIEALEADTARCKQLGMNCKTAIHPGQIEVINRAFTPTAKQVEEAKEILSVYHEALERGMGACTLRGQMIDAPIAARAQKILDKARLLSVTIL